MTEHSQPVVLTTEENDGAALARFAGGAPSHPAIEIRYSRGSGRVSTSKVYHTGLTKRELFAAMAMQSVRAVNPACSSQEVAQSAVADADALLKELAK